MRKLLAILTAVALLALPACAGGAGGSYDCSDPSDDGTCTFIPDPVDDSPTDPPDPGSTPLPNGCVDSADMLYPVQYPASPYANIIYFAIPYGESISTGLAVQVQYSPNGLPPYTTITGTNVVQSVRPPAYVAPPLASSGYYGIFQSSGLPLPANETVNYYVVDQNSGLGCASVYLGGFVTTTSPSTFIRAKSRKARPAVKP